MDPNPQTNFELSHQIMSDTASPWTEVNLRLHDMIMLLLCHAVIHDSALEKQELSRSQAGHFTTAVLNVWTLMCLWHRALLLG